MLTWKIVRVSKVSIIYIYIYIYKYELFCYIIGILHCEARLGFFSFPSENPLIDLFLGGGGGGGGGRITCITSASKLQQNKRRPPMIGEEYATCLFAKIVFPC